MAEYLGKTWAANPSVGTRRRDRGGCLYNAYLPDKLLPRSILLDGDVSADISEAESALTRLNIEATALTNTEVLARLLLRAESVASSKIEGLIIGGRRLLRAELSAKLNAETRDITAEDVLRNVDAMMWAVEAFPGDRELTLDALLEINRRLLTGTSLEQHAGKIRDQQNWIGGSGFNPCAASYVPPPPERVVDLMEDLVEFCNRDSLPAIVQAALAHAQFETIHPFVDGNGRTGRTLIHMILRRRGLAPRLLPPISLILATWSQDYVEGLTASRYVGSSDSAQAHQGLNQWIALFATACRRSVEDASAFEIRIRELQTEWRVRLGTVRRNSALDQLIEVLPGAPLVTVNSAAAMLGRSFQATSDAIERMAEEGIVSQITLGRRNRAFEAREVVDAFMALERQLASPSGDTQVTAPARDVPPRVRRTRAGPPAHS